VVTHSGRGAADPSAQDVSAWSLDVDTRAVVGEAGLGVVLVSGTYSAGGGLRGRGEAGGVGVAVASGDGKEESLFDESRGGGVYGGRVAAT